MSVELAILKAFCLDKSYYNDYYPYIRSMTKKDRIISILFRLVHEYYDKYTNCEDIEKDDFEMWYDHQYPNSRERDIFMEMIDSAFKKKVKPNLIKDLIEQYLEKYYSNQIVTKLMPVIEGNKTGSLINAKAIIEEYTAMLTNPPDEVKIISPLDMTTAEIVQHTIANKGYQFPFERVNDIIGGIRECSNGLLYGYVDSGKSSLAHFIIQHVCEQIKDTEDKVLYCVNEETAVRAGGRATMAFTGFDQYELLNPEIIVKADEIKAAKGWSRLKICDGVETGDQIIRLMDEWRPKILVVDQATDVEMDFRRNNEGVEWLKQLFKWYRRLGNTYECAVIGVAQAVGEAEDTKYLKLTDIYGSRVGIQGALDWAIGIGKKENDVLLTDIRYLNIPKNKYGGKGKLNCTFNHETAQWRQNA